MRAQSTNLYRTLQVDPCAEDAVIRAAYRALMKLHHPDRGGTGALAQQINAAYATLADPVAREAYDRLVDLRRPAGAPPRGRRPGRVHGTRSLIEELGGEVFRRFLPDFPEGMARVWDFTGVLRETPRHRLWLKRFWRGDAADARAFHAAVEAARLSRPLWGWGSDFFVAVLGVATPDFRWLLRGPSGPVARLSRAVALYDLSQAELHAIGRSAELPTFQPFVTALAEARTSGSSTHRSNT
jgi:hypothetical protein